MSPSPSNAATSLTNRPTLGISSLIHGADYNPEQWSDHPEILAADLSLIPQAGLNCVSLGIFSWSALEPEEGRFSFRWLDTLMDNLHARGTRVIMATPSAGRPVWLSRRYEEVRCVGRDGKRSGIGGRLNLCPSSPVWRDKVSIINRQLATRYAYHPAVVLWHVSNELSNECFCNLCFVGFRRWLQSAYSTIDYLNKAWWNSFWSHSFTSFEDIVELDGSITGMNLDWKRFQSDVYVDYVRSEMAPLRLANPNIPITTNFVPSCRVPEQRRMVAELDVVSWDAYPGWHTGDDLACAANNAFFADLYRVMAHKKPLLQMETTPSQVNWGTDSPLKRPGVHRLTALQAIAHGADGVSYFQWRAGRGGCEQFHGAVIDHTNTADTRVVGEVTEVGRDFKALGKVIGSPVVSSIGLVFEWDSLWAVEAASLVGNRRKDYEPTCVAHHRALWQQSHPIDVICCDDDLSAYRLIIAPMLYILDESRATRLRAWVAGGGTLVLSYFSGVVNEHGLAHLGGSPGPLRDVAGLWVEEIDALPGTRPPRILGQPNAVMDVGNLGTAIDYAAIVRLTGAESVASYVDEFYAGTPALTCHRFGRGECWFMAARMGHGALVTFYQALTARVGVSPVRADLPVGVTATRRGIGAEATTFLMNWTPQPLHGLAPYGCSYEAG